MDGVESLDCAPCSWCEPLPRETPSATTTAAYSVRTQFNKKKEKLTMKHSMKNTLKRGSIALGLGLMLTALCQAQQEDLHGAPSATPLNFKVPPHALSAISFSTAPNAQCSVAPA